MSRYTRPALALAASLLLSACGNAVPGDQPMVDPAAGTCLEGTPDCVDADLDGAEPVLDDGMIDDESVLRDARSLIGETEEEVLSLWDDVRVGRRGGEHLMLTEDYVIGRKTIAVEDDGTGTFRVVEVVVEASYGPVTVTDAD